MRISDWSSDVCSSDLGWGWYMSRLPVGGDKLHAYEVHSAAGLPILLLAIGRLGWRIAIPGPVNDADRQGWQKQVAYSLHYVFYICFFALPLSGWRSEKRSVGEGSVRLCRIGW